MSSLFTIPDYSRPNRAIASSPVLAPRPAGPIKPSEDVSVRPMRLKVLYTFDDENKTNCLARWPQPLDIRTAYLDENTQIGVIELKTCIQAIVAASPELVAKLGQDYTVYAYDYSEYETPLVGQGMLSWVLASSSSTPSAPAHQSRTIVTGRVCKNILALFSSNAQETLEVKLRLVPVPTSLQSEYIESMKKYRDMSQMMPQGFDPQAWTSFIQANPGFFQQAMQSRSQSPATGSGQMGAFGIEHVQRLLNADGHHQGSLETQRTMSRTNSFANADVGQQLPRLPSPASSVQSTATAPKRRGRPPGPKGPRARAGKQQEIRLESNDPGYGSNEERTEEGPMKKRAKVTQAEWSGKQDFGKQPESLRVAASTAASIRIHQPTAKRLGANPALSLEGPPRVPTPIADSSDKMQRPLLPAPKNSLLRESSISQKKIYASPYVPAEGFREQPESSMTSPENSRANSSPVDIASSPPIYRDASTAPSSPNLPTLQHHFNDSGFMSGSIDDLFEDDASRPLDDDDDTEMLTRYSKRPNLPIPTPEQGSMQNMSGPNENIAEHAQSDAAMVQSKNVTKTASGTRLLTRTASSGNISPPAVPASDPIRPSTLNRSQTWAGHQAPNVAFDMAPMPPVMESVERPASRSRKGSESGSGSGVRRKQAIQSKLASSVAAGEMPPFCENCGAIETPTWRKAWVRIHSGTPEHVVISEEEGGIIAWQTLQTDNTGTICLYRIIKKSLLKTDEGFTEVLLCNPCGLWLHTRKCMRPKETWDKTQRGPDEKRKRGPGRKRLKSGSMSNLTTNDLSGSAVYSDASSPANDAGGQTDRVEAEPQLPVAKRPRASSVERTSAEVRARTMDDASAAAALERAIKSSPHKFIGTQHVPIQVDDLTPQPTRRILFPSPTQSQEANSKRNSISGSTYPESKGSSDENSARVYQDQADKENRPPPNTDVDLNQFLEDDHEFISQSIPPTPTKSNKLSIFKTPKRSPNRPPPTTGDFFSSAAKALLRPPATPKRTPTRNTQPLEELTPFTAHLNQLLSDANNGSPGQSTFDFPSLPSLHNTPGRSRTMDFDFSQFDSQDFLSTDVPMPSSPPAWFGVYEDPIEAGSGSLWGDYSLPNTIHSPDEAGDGDVCQNDTKSPSLVVEENGMTSIDFQALA